MSLYDHVNIAITEMAIALSAFVIGGARKISLNMAVKL